MSAKRIKLVVISPSIDSTKPAALDSALIVVSVMTGGLTLVMSI